MMSIKPAMHPPAGRAYLQRSKCVCMYLSANKPKCMVDKHRRAASACVRARGTRRTTRCRQLYVLRPAMTVRPARWAILHLTPIVWFSSLETCLRRCVGWQAAGNGYQAS